MIEVREKVGALGQQVVPGVAFDNVQRGSVRRVGVIVREFLCREHLLAEITARRERIDNTDRAARVGVAQYDDALLHNDKAIDEVALLEDGFANTRAVLFKTRRQRGVLFVVKPVKGLDQNKMLGEIHKFSFNFCAAFRFIPFTCASSSTVAARILSSEPKWLSRARRRIGPMPGIESNCEASPLLARTER